MANRRWGTQLLVKAVASLVLLLGAQQVHATSITYIVNDTVVGDTITGTVTGFITTNGALGPLGQSDLIAWSLTLNSGSSSNTITDLDSNFTQENGHFTATALGLFYNFNGLDGDMIFDSNFGNGTFCMTSGTYLCALGRRGDVDTIAPLYYTSTTDTAWQFRSGNYQFATVSGVPLPAALPLFATGLGALGVLGWRRKRKAKAAA